MLAVRSDTFLDERAYDQKSIDFTSPDHWVNNACVRRFASAIIAALLWLATDALIPGVGLIYETDGDARRLA